MELKIGGVYLIKRKPMKSVDLLEFTNGHYKKLYNLTMNCKVLSIQDKIHGDETKHLVCFLSGGGKEGYGLGTVDYLYTHWLERAELRKVLRDMRDWPENARQHFLMVRGASSEASVKGDLETARHSIARNDRANRLYKERQKEEKKKLGKKGMVWTSDYATAGSTYHAVIDTGTSTARYAPKAEMKIKYDYETEWVETPDMPEEEYFEDEVLTLKTYEPPKPKKKKKRKPRKKKNAVKNMNGEVAYLAPPVTTVTHETKPHTLSAETLAKVKKEMDEKASEEKKELFKKFYGGWEKTAGYGKFEKKMAKKKKPNKTFKEWAMEAEAHPEPGEEEME